MFFDFEKPLKAGSPRLNIIQASKQSKVKKQGSFKSSMGKVRGGSMLSARVKSNLSKRSSFRSVNSKAHVSEDSQEMARRDSEERKRNKEKELRNYQIKFKDLP